MKDKIANTEGRWSLNVLYKSMEDPNFQTDREALFARIKELRAMGQEMEAFLQSNPEKVFTAKAEAEAHKIFERYILRQEELECLAARIFNFLQLSSAVDKSDMKLASALNKIYFAFGDIAKTDVFAKQILAKMSQPEKLTDSRELMGLESFISHLCREASHMMDPEAEEAVSRMENFAGNKWENMFEVLTSGLKVKYGDQEITLSEVRNLSSDPDAKVRKQAYDAEIASYAQIEMPLAFALNAIKGEVNYKSKARGFATALDEALFKSRMQKATLDAMWHACQEYLPHFRRYLKAKAKFLGQEKLNFWDLNAPLGKDERKYSLEEAKEMLLQSFGKLNPHIADLMGEAFENQWIDFYPRPNKVGGAFCSNIPFAKQSRVLTNYDGTIGAIDTLAHELGHAFHGKMIEEHRPLNWNYSMPVAETASTFNETHFLLQNIADAENKEQKVALLDGFLGNFTATVVDIYSRFLFEQEVFARVNDEFLSPADLKEIMHRAQLASYGEGLEETSMHPYMWACKVHYYSAELSFYNFPYAFGSLFAMGLYNLRRQEGESFNAKYEKLLHLTTVGTVEETASSVGIDLTKEEFWLQSLESIKEVIDEFCALVE